jgi:hypothetical protein
VRLSGARRELHDVRAMVSPELEMAIAVDVSARVRCPLRPEIDEPAVQSASVFGNESIKTEVFFVC